MGFGYAELRKVHRRQLKEMARAIKKRFPSSEFPRVADVAGGDGRLTSLLIKEGYRVTIIDPAGCKVKGSRVLKRKFLVRDAQDYDLLVGFYPCQASQKLLRAAKYKPVVFHPCKCRHHWPGGRDPRIEAQAFMKKQGVTYERDGSFIFHAWPNGFLT